MTDIAHMHLLLVSDYSRVLCAQQDTLVSITYTTGFTHEYSIITCEYKNTRQELFPSIFNPSAIACEQCASRVAQDQHSSYLQIFSRHETLLMFFCKLGCELYCRAGAADLKNQ